MGFYYDKKVTVKSEESLYNTEVNGIKMVFKTDNGVFCKKYLDFGTKLLLENYSESPLQGPILDMCSGYGPVGVFLAKTTKEDIYMTEINERAYNLSQKNLELNNCKAHVYNGNLYEELPMIKFKNILVNPAIRAGKDIVFAIYEGAKERLMDGGALWVVIQKKQGAPSTIKKLEELFSSVSIVKRDAGYYIIEAK